MDEETKKEIENLRQIMEKQKKEIADLTVRVKDTEKFIKDYKAAIRRAKGPSSIG